MNKLIDDIIKNGTGSGGSGNVQSIIIEASSHTTKEGYEVPVLTDDQITNAYNGVVAGNNVFIVDDLSTITIQVLDACSIDEVSIRILFTDKLILQYKLGGEIIATPIINYTDDMLRAGLLRLGITVDTNGFVKWST